MLCPEAGVKSPRSINAFGTVARRVYRSIEGGLGADDGGELVSPERQVEADQAIIDALRQTGQSSQYVVPDAKGDTSVESLCHLAAAPKEDVAGTRLLQLALLREAGFAESSSIQRAPCQFTSE
ncbi:unnamed protein product [Schistocephalus solidus]|uniref:ANK_REP_REGION domain-containing protein n=1 Tax=Schistocephalus solidus TaxID=70667 RepID=A0A183T1A3_SCHSO|nr:unnamed protein product [Schistocephalus solidus]